MMNAVSRRFTYNKKRLVMLVCDFYENKKLPEEILSVETNIGLFPILKRPLIDFILQELHNQKFKSVILVGKKLDKVIEYVEGSKFSTLMEFSYLDNNYNPYGSFPIECMADIFKALRPLNVTESFLVIQANQYVNINFNKLFEFHKSGKNIMSFLLYKRDSNDPESYYYTLNKNKGEILYCDKFSNKDFNNNGNIKKENIEAFNSPNIFIASPQTCKAFEEMPHCTDILDFIQQMNELSQGDFPIKYSSPEVLEGSKPFSLKSPDLSDDGKVTTNFYCKEITTLNDFVELSQDLLFNEEGDITSLLSMSLNLLTNTSSIHDWSIIPKSENRGYVIDLGDGRVIDCFMITYVERCVVKSKPRNFFDELIGYLSKEYMRNQTIDNESLIDNLRLFRIVWDTNDFEVLEAFADFFINGIKLKTKIGVSIADAVQQMTNFILIIRDLSRQSIEYQIHFMDTFTDEVGYLEYDNKRELVLEYFKLFKELRFIKRKLIKEYVLEIDNFLYK